MRVGGGEKKGEREETEKAARREKAGEDGCSTFPSCRTPRQPRATTRDGGLRNPAQLLSTHLITNGD